MPVKSKSQGRLNWNDTEQISIEWQEAKVKSGKIRTILSRLAKSDLKQKSSELLHLKICLASSFVMKLHLCILYTVWPRSFDGEVDLCIVWHGCLLVKWTSRAAARNLTQMSGHDVKLAGVCISQAQSFGSGSWPKHGGYAWGHASLLRQNKNDSSTNHN